MLILKLALIILQAKFNIVKAVPLNTSLRVECSIQKVKGARCWVDGAVKDASGQVTFATCEAQLADLRVLFGW